TDSPSTRFKEKSPGSQPVAITPRLLFALAAASTAAKCSGTLAWVSKLSTTTNCCTYCGVCSGKSVAEPPQSTSTSTLPWYASSSDTCTKGALACCVKEQGSRRLKIATNSISLFFCIAASTPRPKLP